MVGEDIKGHGVKSGFAAFFLDMLHLEQQALAQVTRTDPRQIAVLQPLDPLGNQLAGDTKERAGFIQVNLKVAPVIETIHEIFGDQRLFRTLGGRPQMQQELFPQGCLGAGQQQGVKFAVAPAAALTTELPEFVLRPRCQPLFFGRLLAASCRDRLAVRQ